MSAQGSDGLSQSDRPAIPVDELRRRFDALGRLEEWPGERTIISHCGTFEFLLDRGAITASLLRREIRLVGEERACWPHPALCRLVLEAWPATSDRV